MAVHVRHNPIEFFNTSCLGCRFEYGCCKRRKLTLAMTSQILDWLKQHQDDLTAILTTMNEDPNSGDTREARILVYRREWQSSEGNIEIICINTHAPFSPNRPLTAARSPLLSSPPVFLSPLPFAGRTGFKTLNWTSEATKNFNLVHLVTNDDDDMSRRLQVSDVTVHKRRC